MTASIQRRLAAVLVAVAAAGASGPLAQAAVPGTTEALTLAAAVDAALAHHPRIAAGEAAVEEARGRLTTARTYPFNPTLELAAGDRTAAGTSSTDRSVTLSQEIEIAGQRGKRTAVGRAELAAAEARLARLRLQVAAETTRRYALALRARELRALAAADVDLTRELVSLEGRRLEAGSGTQLSVNVARAAAGRALRDLREAEADWSSAQAALATALGMAPRTLAPLAGDLSPPAPLELDLDRLVPWALARRDDLRALRRELEARRRQVSLERALRIPNLGVGAFSDREGEEQITGALVAVPIPLFNRNRGGIAEARAAVRGAEAELATAELAVRREVATAYAHYQGAIAAAADLGRLAVGTLEESLDLLRRALAAGKINTSDVLLLRRELFDARREAVEAGGEAWVARADLELALGARLDEENPR